MKINIVGPEILPDQSLALSLGNSKKNSPLNLEIWNCEQLLEFKCPKKWAELELTAEENVRYCNMCSRNVYFCLTPEEFVKKGQQGECVGIPTNLTPKNAEITVALGRPSRAEAKKWKETSQNCLNWWRKVLRQGEFFTNLASNGNLLVVREYISSLIKQNDQNNQNYQQFIFLELVKDVFDAMDEAIVKRTYKKTND